MAGISTGSGIIENPDIGSTYRGVIPTDVPAPTKTKVGLSGASDPRGVPTVRAVAFLAYNGGGPLHLGCSGDKHGLGKDQDGHPINGMHLSVDSLFYLNPDKDAPLAFSSDPFPKGLQNLSRKVPVYLAYNPLGKHKFLPTGDKAGIWEWYSFAAEATLPTPTPPSKGRIPTTPPPKPPPPKPPTTPNNPQPRPPPPTTPNNPQPPAGGPTLDIGAGLADFGDVDDGFDVGGHATVRAADRAALFPRSISSGPMERGMPALLWRPQFGNASVVDLRYDPSPDDFEVDRQEAARPGVVRMQAVGKQDGLFWSYTQKPQASTVYGGTAPGVLQVLPPELDTEDLADLDAASTGGVLASLPSGLSTVYLAFADATRLGFGHADRTTGGLKDKGVALYRGTGSDRRLTIAQQLSSAYVELMTAYASGTERRVAALGSSGFGLPSGASSTRDAAPSAGETRENTDTGALEFYDGTAWVVVPRVLARVTSQTAVSNSTVETTIFTYSVPANLLGSVQRLLLELSGKITNSSGSTFTATIKVKLGGTTLWANASGNITSAAGGNRAWQLRIDLQEMNATNAQRGVLTWLISNSATPTTGEAGVSLDITASRGPSTFTGAKDGTGSLTLEVTLTLNTADGAFSASVEEGSLRVE